jgi:hypothetical protein
MFKRKAIVACGIVGLAGAVAWACGPMFPNQLLDNRTATLKAAPVNSFAFEAARLLPATDQLKPVEGDTSIYADNKKVEPDLGLTAAQQADVEAMKKLDDDDSAYAVGKDLPEDVRLYTLGAKQFGKAMDSCNAPQDKDAGAETDPYGASSEDPNDQPRRCIGADPALLDKAVASFEKVVALPPEQARLRSVWAAYMLGRIHALRALSQAGDAAAFKRERDAAAKAFELARTRAVAGASDTQGLGVASFGEQAQLYLYSGKTLCTWGHRTICGAGWTWLG